MRRSIKLLIAAIAAAVILVVGGTWLYINVIEDDPPAKFTLTDDTTSNAGGDVAGTWKVSPGSQAGYRVKEVLFGQDNTAVGRTSDVAGTVTIDGTTVTSAKVTVDLTSVSSDQSRRDAQFEGRIMDTGRYPTATFELTEPVDVRGATDGKLITVKATGKLRAHGTTRTVTVDLQTKRSAATIEVTGAIPVVFADYGIPSPSFGPISTEDHGEIEFKLELTES